MATTVLFEEQVEVPLGIQSLADFRGRDVVFLIHHRQRAGFQPTRPDADGFQPSVVFGRRFRLDAGRDPQGHWMFDLRV